VGASDSGALDTVGRTLFAVSTFVLVVFVFFATPGLAADLVVSERRRETLDILLTTPLSPVSILLAKLGARLAPLAVMVAASFPIVSVSLLFGGVRTEQVLGLFALSLGTILGTAGPALLVSTCARRLGTAATLSYVLPLFFVFALPALVGILVPDDAAATPILVVLHPLFAAIAVSVENGAPFPEPLPAGLLHLGAGAVVAALCVAGAALRLGRERSGSALPDRLLGLLVALRLRRPDATARRPGRLFRGMANPVLWKEVNLVNASHSRVLLLIILVLFGTLEALLIVSGESDDRIAHLMILGAEGLLLLVVTASNAGACVASERESGSLDLLRVTLLTPADIARGKVAGVLRSLLPLAAVPLAHVLVYGLLGPLSLSAFPALLSALAALLLFFAVSGVTSSSIHPRAAKAVRRSIALVAILVVGVPILLMILATGSRGVDTPLEFLAFSNPIAIIVFPVEHLSSSRSDTESARFLIYAAAWAGLYFLVALLRFARLPAVLDRALRRDDPPGS
jgi:ABC-type transport system involved in multi-copper enzyme maturation permease subunit